MNALQKNKSGNGNTVHGRSALENNTTGFNNIALGFDAGRNVTTGNNNIHIGNSGVASDTTTIKVGTVGLQNKTFIAGISGINSGAAAIHVLVDGTGRIIQALQRRDPGHGRKEQRSYASSTSNLSLFESLF